MLHRQIKNGLKENCLKIIDPEKNKDNLPFFSLEFPVTGIEGSSKQDELLTILSLMLILEMGTFNFLFILYVHCLWTTRAFRSFFLIVPIHTWSDFKGTVVNRALPSLLTFKKCGYRFAKVIKSCLIYYCKHNVFCWR